MDVQAAAGAFIMKLPKGANGQARATPPAEQPLHVFAPFLPDSGIVAGHRRGQYTVLVLIRFCFPPRVSSSSRRLIRESALEHESRAWPARALPCSAVIELTVGKTPTIHAPLRGATMYLSLGRSK